MNSQELQEFHYCPFAVKLDRCVENFNTLNDLCECKKHHVSEKDYVWNLATCNCENGKYLGSIMDHSASTCDEIIESYNEETKTILTNFNEKKATRKTQNYFIFYLLFYFTFITCYSVIDSC